MLDRSQARKVVIAIVIACALAPMSLVFAQDTTLTVVGVNVPPEEVGSPLDLAYQSVVSTFEEQNPNVAVNVVEQPPEFETQIMVDLAAGTAPDVWRAGQAQLPELIEGGYLLDVALMQAVELGWIEGPRIWPAGHAICPTGGHLDPSTQSALAPHMMPLSVEEGIADGIDEVRRAVRYQVKHGAKLIKCCASGGVATRGLSGAQQYSTEELAAIADEAHRRGLRVATHCHGDMAVNAALDAGIDCIEHGFMITEDTVRRMVDAGTFLVSTNALTENWDLDQHPEGMRAKAAEVFPKAKASLSLAIEAGVKIACGSDAPAIFHGRNAEELEVLVKRGMTPLQAIRAATVVSADLIEAPDLGRIAPEMLADIIGVRGEPLNDISVTRKVPFVMQDGKVRKHVAA